MTFARLAVVFHLTVIIGACAEKPLRFPGPHPTFEQLLAMVPPEAYKSEIADKPIKFALQLLPQHGIVFAGGAAHVRCLVPRLADHRRVAYGIPGIAMSERDLDGADAAIEWSVMVERIPCGTWEAVCVVSSSGGRVERRSHPITSKGMCNDSDGDDR